MFCLTSKATVYMWRKNRGFPAPVTIIPLRWLRSTVEDWELVRRLILKRTRSIGFCPLK